LYKQLTFIVDDPQKVYPTASVIWTRFVLLYRSTLGLLLYSPIFKASFYQALQQYYDDGVQYVEMRTLLLPVFSRFYMI